MSKLGYILRDDVKVVRTISIISSSVSKPHAYSQPVSANTNSSHSPAPRSPLCARQAPYIPMLRSNKDLAYVNQKSGALLRKVERMQKRYLHNQQISLVGVEFPNF